MELIKMKVQTVQYTIQKEENEGTFLVKLSFSFFKTDVNINKMVPVLTKCFSC